MGILGLQRMVGKQSNQRKICIDSSDYLRQGGCDRCCFCGQSFCQSFCMQYYCKV